MVSGGVSELLDVNYRRAVSLAAWVWCNSGLWVTGIGCSDFGGSGSPVGVFVVIWTGLRRPILIASVC